MCVEMCARQRGGAHGCGGGALLARAAAHPAGGASGEQRGCASSMRELCAWRRLCDRRGMGPGLHGARAARGPRPLSRATPSPGAGCGPLAFRDTAIWFGFGFGFGGVRRRRAASGSRAGVLGGRGGVAECCPLPVQRVAPGGLAVGTARLSLQTP